MPKSERIRFTPEQLVEWTRVVPIEELKQHPRNARQGDVETIETSIEAHGQFVPKLVSSDLFFLAGNHTYQAALGRGLEAMAVTVLPIPHDHPQALEILMADNKASDGAGYDDFLAVGILKDIQEAMGTLEASLWSDRELAKMASRLDGLPPDPEGDSKTAAEAWNVLITCENESQQTELIDRLVGEGYAVKALVA